MLLWQAANDRPLEPMKSKCGIRNSACSSAQAIFTNSNSPPPAMLLVVPAGAALHLSSHDEPAELSSHFHLFLSQQDGWMLRRADREKTNLTRQTSHCSPPPAPPPFHFLAPPSSSVTLLCHSFISPLPLMPSPPLPTLLFLSLSDLWLGWRQFCGNGSSMGLEESSGTKQS